jgi:uncharacterized membrane protein (DUF2068 family)
VQHNEAVEAVQQLAALTTGSELRDWILIVVGNVFMAFLAVRGFGHWLKKEWGEMITMFVAAIFLAAAIWAPDAVKGILTGIWNKVAGT